MRTLLALIISVACLAAAEAPSPAGEWRGRLVVGAAELRLKLVVQQSGAGQPLTATLYSLDQGPDGIPASEAKMEEARLKFDFPKIKGSYEAHISEDGKMLSGTWSQSGNSMPLNLARINASDPPDPVDAGSASAAPLLGIWEGALDTGAARLRLRFTLRKDEKGQIIGSADSIDQNSNGMPMSGIVLKGQAFHFDLRGVGGAYDGVVDATGTSIRGTWKQGPGELPLEWKKVDKPSALNRPQNPRKPYPYREEDVKYLNAKAVGVELAGTLTIPAGKGPFPAVVLISGSGPQDQDESLMGHKPFLVLADHMSRNGIAVLRFDDRGTHKSTGQFDTATSADFAMDAEAGIVYLQTRADIDHKRIGLLGHSEGGLIAPMVAARSKDVAFLVLIAAPGGPGSELLMTQARLVMKAAGKQDTEVEKIVSAQREAFALLRTEKDDAILKERLAKIVEAAGAPSGSGAASINMMLTPWFRYFLSYDPRTDLKKVQVPVLAVNGSLDLQVEPKANLAGLRTAFTEGGNTKATVVELAGLNHLLQKASTGAVSEYGTIEETIHPSALDTITNWIVTTTRP